MFHEHIKDRIQRLEIKKGEFAVLAGVSPSALSGFLRGRKEIKDAKRLETLLSEVESLKKCFPIPLGLHDAKLLGVALERFRAGKFKAFAELTKATDWEKL